MKEHIFTIPLNDYFGKIDGCPLCGLFAMLEKNEIETITGASMMESSIRIKTNEMGFCHNHFDMMTKIGKRLSVALILQSHLEELYSSLSKKKNADQTKVLTSVESSCYVCSRIKNNMDSIYSNFFYLYKKDENFLKFIKQQPFFCLPHYNELVTYGAKYLSKKEFVEFFNYIWEIENKYLKELQGDIDWFCKKFDYRFKEESWKNSRDAIERTVYTLTGKEIKDKGDITV